MGKDLLHRTQLLGHHLAHQGLQLVDLHAVWPGRLEGLVHGLLDPTTFLVRGSVADRELRRLVEDQPEGEEDEVHVDQRTCEHRRNPHTKAGRPSRSRAYSREAVPPVMRVTTGPRKAVSDATVVAADRCPLSPRLPLVVFPV